MEDTVSDCQHAQGPLLIEFSSVLQRELYKPPYSPSIATRKTMDHALEVVSSRSKAAETDEGEQKKLVASQLLTETAEPLSRPEASRVSLDSRIVKSKMLHSPETSRLSSDHADKRAKAFV
ncbi:hypothetical protein KSP40_PGU013184 [Platanthera guangdongensis]|uniref:Uncharacterized protein n=1 Tax=Platanthera guangdongensis TaxID=2320717 RepID=A0ABR2LED0_9ASPA